MKTIVITGLILAGFVLAGCSQYQHISVEGDRAYVSSFVGNPTWSKKIETCEVTDEGIFENCKEVR